MGQLAMQRSLLFTAPYTGTFVCQIRAHTDAGNDHGYHLTAVTAPRPGGTWLEVDNFTGDAPQWRQSIPATRPAATPLYFPRQARR
jgi:hypothetical protein